MSEPEPILALTNPPRLRLQRLRISFETIWRLLVVALLAGIFWTQILLVREARSLGADLDHVDAHLSGSLGEDAEPDRLESIDAKLSDISDALDQFAARLRR